MHRVISYLSAAIIAFIVGLAAHSGVDTLGGFAVEKLCDVAPLAELKTATLLPESESIPARAHSCGHLVVSVADDGSLYLNRELAGTLDDPGALSAMLRTIFERREELHVYVGSPELSSGVPEHRQIEKTVYIKAPRSMSYGEVADLIEVIKEAGADPIGLVVRGACQNGERVATRSQLGAYNPVATARGSDRAEASGTLIRRLQDLSVSPNPVHSPFD